MADRDDVGLAVRELAGLLLSEETLSTTLDRVVSLAVASVPGCDGAGVSLVSGDSVRTVAASEEMVHRADAAQYVLGEGPCLEAIRTGRPSRVDEIATERRWPRWCAAARDAGLAGAAGFPLSVGDHCVGAMNLYCRAPGCMTDDVMALGGQLAEQAAVALANTQLYEQARTLTEQLEEALRSRAVIDQAKGVLMARESCSPDDAFDMLRRASQRSNRKLRDLAAEVVENAQRGMVRR